MEEYKSIDINELLKKLENQDLSLEEIQNVLNTQDSDGNSLAMILITQENLSLDDISFIIKNTDINHKNKNDESFLFKLIQNNKLMKNDLEHILNHADLSLNANDTNSIAEYILYYGVYSFNKYTHEYVKDSFTNDELDKLLSHFNLSLFMSNFYLGELSHENIDRIIEHAEKTLTNNEKIKLFETLIKFSFNYSKDKDPNLTEKNWFKLCEISCSGTNILNKKYQVQRLQEINNNNKEIFVNHYLIDNFNLILKLQNSKTLQNENLESIFEKLKNKNNNFSSKKLQYILKNANLDAKDNDGNSLAMLLIQQNELSFDDIDFIVKNTNINHKNKNEESFLILYLKNKKLTKNNLDYILEHGHINSRDKNGLSACDYILNFGVYEKIVTTYDYEINEEHQEYIPYTFTKDEEDKLLSNFNLSLFMSKIYLGNLSHSTINKLIKNGEKNLNDYDKEDLFNSIVFYALNFSNKDSNITDKNWISLCNAACSSNNNLKINIDNLFSMQEKHIKDKKQIANPELMTTLTLILILDKIKNNVNNHNTYDYLFEFIKNNNNLSESNFDLILKNVHSDTINYNIDPSSTKKKFDSVVHLLLQKDNITKQQIQFILTHADLNKYNNNYGTHLAKTILNRKEIINGDIVLEPQEYDKLFENLNFFNFFKEHSSKNIDTELLTKTIKSSKDNIKGSFILFLFLNEKFKNENEKFYSLISHDNWKLLFDYGINSLDKKDKDKALNMLLYGTHDNSGSYSFLIPKGLIDFDVVLKLLKDKKINPLLNLNDYLENYELTQKDLERIIKETDLNFIYHEKTSESVGFILLKDYSHKLSNQQLDFLLRNTQLNQKNDKGETFLSYYVRTEGVNPNNVKFIIENGYLSIENFNKHKKINNDKTPPNFNLAFTAGFYEFFDINMESISENIVHHILTADNTITLNDDEFNKIMKSFNFIRFFKNSSFNDFKTSEFNHSFINKMVDYYVKNTKNEEKMILLILINEKAICSEATYFNTPKFELSNENWLKLYEFATSSSKLLNNKFENKLDIITKNISIYKSKLYHIPEIFRLNIDLAIKICEKEPSNLDTLHPLLIQKLGLNKNNLKEKLFIYKHNLFLDSFLGKGKKKLTIQNELNEKFLRLESTFIHKEKTIELLNNNEYINKLKSLNSSIALEYIPLIQPITSLIYAESEINMIDFVGVKDNTKLQFKKDIEFVLPSLLNDLFKNPSVEKIESIKTFIKSNQTLLNSAKTSIFDELSLKLRKETIIEPIEINQLFHNKEEIKLIEEKNKTIEQKNKDTINKEDSNNTYLIDIYQVKISIKNLYQYLSQDETKSVKSILHLATKIQKDGFKNLHEYQINLLKYQLENSLVQALTYYSLFPEKSQTTQTGHSELSAKENLNLILEKISINLLHSSNISITNPNDTISTKTEPSTEINSVLNNLFKIRNNPILSKTKNLI